MSKVYRVVLHDRVTDLLAEGWELYGNPMVSSNGSVKQAVIKDYGDTGQPNPLYPPDLERKE